MTTNKKTEKKKAKAVEDVATIKAREKARIDAEEKEFEAMSDEDKAKNSGLMKRIRTRRKSQEKEAKASEWRKSKKTFKVHMKGEVRPKIVKAVNKKEAIKAAGEGAFQAILCGEKYELPKATK
jgi:hypothetical protein